MTQQDLIPIDLDQAIDDLIRATGGYKTVAYSLWPTRTPSTAYARIKSCLDPSQENTNFSQAELVWLLQRGRQTGNHGLAAYLMGEAGYQDPVPAAQVSQKERLLERDAALAAERVAVAKELREIEQAETMQNVAELKELRSA